MIRAAAFILVSATLLAPASAQIAMTGSFIAARACPAYQSIRRQTNPDGATLVPGKAYALLGRNKDEATHYLVRVEGAAPSERWVETGCGSTDAASAATPASPPAGGTRATHVLAMSWQPAFCAEHGEKTECARKAYDATQFSLHGLWPQPRGKAYCNVDPALVAADRRRDWAALPAPELDEATRNRLAAVMPGVQSGLERHEWIVHGTCYGGSANAYFARAATLAEALNAGAVRALFAQNIGKTLAADAIRSAFDRAYGPGAGARVTISCRGKGDGRVISELVIALAGDVTGAAPLGDLIAAAAPVPSSCPSGLVASQR